jgi:hypothetical protein
VERWYVAVNSCCCGVSSSDNRGCRDMYVRRIRLLLRLETDVTTLKSWSMVCDCPSK